MLSGKTMPVDGVRMMPGSLPLLGHTAALLLDPLGFLQSVRRRGDIAAIRWGTSVVYVVNAPELIRHMLVDEKGHYSRSGLLFDRLGDVTGQGLIASHGDDHRRQKSLLSPAFHTNRLGAYTQAMWDEGERVVGAWQPGQVIDVEREMFKIAAFVIARFLFGRAASERVAEQFHDLISGMFKELALRVQLPSLERLPSLGRRSFAARKRSTDELTGDLVRSCRSNLEQQPGLMAHLMRARDRDTGRPLTDAELIDQAVTMMIGGTETSSASLTWLFHQLGQHPEIERLLHQEVDAELGDAPALAGTFSRLPYTQQVINETLRRHNPAWLLSRQTRTATQLGKTRLPAGATLLYSLSTLLRDPVLYPDPERFDPGRWSSGDQPAPFMPFGAGPYKCIGDHFAVTEMQVVVPMIAARWKLVPVPRQRVKEKPRATVRPSALHMTVTPRRSTSRT